MTLMAMAPPTAVTSAQLATTNNRDQDGDGIGDLCDSDDDNDGFRDAVDTCQVTYNPDQIDTDGDGNGDACDTDDDDDGLPDVFEDYNQDGYWNQAKPMPRSLIATGMV